MLSGPADPGFLFVSRIYPAPLCRRNKVAVVSQENNGRTARSRSPRSRARPGRGMTIKDFWDGAMYLGLGGPTAAGVRRQKNPVNESSPIL